jgi:hypothetical protein
MYNVELDITHETPLEEVELFAKDHGCTVTLKLENGPAGGNPLYLFQSENWHYIEELTGQILGNDFDEEDIKTMVWES